MARDWEQHLQRWASAGLMDEATAGRIRAWETEHAPPNRLRWHTVVALAMGVLLLGAGVLLFVASHWYALSPGWRLSLVVATTGVFHVTGASAAERFRPLSVALHTVGTIALGAGIALAGQIFNLNEHWPSAILLWAIGAGLAWALLGHWTQGAVAAILVPWWLGAEWWVRIDWQRGHGLLPIVAGVCALSFTYLSARRSADDIAIRKALAWLGGIALLPAVFIVALVGWEARSDWSADWMAWAAVVGVSALASVLLRGRNVLGNAIAVAWTLALAAVTESAGNGILFYAWCAAGALGLAAWGVRESRAERINLGLAGFAITVVAFYFSSVMDKLERSASLIGLGILFLGGGWLLEKTRRRWVARIRPEAT